MSDKVAGAASPSQVAHETFVGVDTPGDAADQAERLSMIMEAEATHNALNGGGGEGSLDELPYPLEDVESVLAMEDADDSDADDHDGDADDGDSDCATSAATSADGDDLAMGALRPGSDY